MRGLKPSAWWGAGFAGLGFALLLGMLVAFSTAGCGPSGEPSDTARAYVAQAVGLDMAFVCSYVAVFLAAAVSWKRRRIAAIVMGAVAIITGLLDGAENLTALANVSAAANGCDVLTLTPGLTAVKWIAAGLMTLAMVFAAPKYGWLSAIFVFVFGIGFAAACVLAAMAALSQVVSAVPNFGAPAQSAAPLLLLPGMLGLSLLLWSEARQDR
jgi:hypothetical protein